MRLGKIPNRLKLLRARLTEQGFRVTWLWAMDHAVRIATGAPRFYTSRIGPGLVVGGQYRRRGWPRMEAAGITGVLNMRIEFCDQEAGIAPPRYLRLATLDDGAPTLDQLRQGVAFIQEQVGEGGCVYVHCGAGVGRAATMAAAYLVSTGLRPADAWATIRRIRPFIRPTRPQLAAIDAYAAAIAALPTAPLPLVSASTPPGPP